MILRELAEQQGFEVPRWSGTGALYFRDIVAWAAVGDMLKVAVHEEDCIRCFKLPRESELNLEELSINEIEKDLKSGCEGWYNKKVIQSVRHKNKKAYLAFLKSLGVRILWKDCMPELHLDGGYNLRLDLYPRQLESSALSVLNGAFIVDDFIAPVYTRRMPSVASTVLQCKENLYYYRDSLYITLHCSRHSECIRLNSNTSLKMLVWELENNPQPAGPGRVLAVGINPEDRYMSIAFKPFGKKIEMPWRTFTGMHPDFLGDLYFYHGYNKEKLAEAIKKEEEKNALNRTSS